MIGQERSRRREKGHRRRGLSRTGGWSISRVESAGSAWRCPRGVTVRREAPPPEGPELTFQI